ncbi:MAG: hypothetical protein CMP23_08825 [Rickettsiales bacterium]|nr:hypothetical protein [Rickettsiales bacterium]
MESIVRRSLLSYTVIGALFLALPGSSSAQVLFAKTTIAELGSFQGATAIEVADIDGDGDTDVVGAAQVDDQIAWWSNANGDGTSWTRQTIASGFDGAYDVAIGDLDGDGDLDVVGVANASDLVSWWEQDTSASSPSWTHHSIATGFTGAIAVELADMDGDNDLDVVAAANDPVTNSSMDDITWWANDGSGGGWNPTIVDSALTDAHDLALADFDGDGAVDVLAISKRSNGKVRYSRNSNGDGSSFANNTLTSSTGITDLSSIAIADIDADGDLDLAFTVASGYGYIRLTTSTAGTTTGLTSTFDQNVEGAAAIRLADIDGDGLIDILASAFEGDRLTWWSQASGSQSPTWVEHTVDQDLDGSLATAVADLNGDGTMELLAASTLAGSIQWWQNAGNYGAQWTLQTLPQQGSIYSVGAADLDDDGDLDYFAAGSSHSARVAWYSNDSGSATGWTRTILNNSNNVSFTHLISGDIDGNGSIDLISSYSASGSSRKIFLWLNSGGGAFSAMSFTGNRAQEATLADMDGDNDLDYVLVSLASDTVEWIENDGAAVLGGASGGDFGTTHVISSSRNNPDTVDAGDIDGDGHPDVAAGFRDDNAIYWWKSAAGGTSWTEVLVGAMDAPECLRMADVDGDGDLDLLSASDGDDGISWWDNVQGDGSVWAEHRISGLVQQHKELLAHDMDEDGDLDVISTSQDTDDVIWWSNDQGDGLSWSEHVIDSHFGNAQAIAVADLDGDGDSDILGGGSGVHGLGWWDLQSSAFSSWSKGFISGSFSGDAGIQLADMDGDTDLDLLTTAQGSDTVSWWSNNGGLGAQWSQILVATGFDGSSSAAAADLDGDGDLDVVGAAESADDLMWWSNDSGTGTAWSRAVIDGDFGAPRRVRTGDLDGDGDLDVVAAGYTDDEISWWENNTSFGQPWIKRGIATGFGGATDLQLVDMDTDGDLDVVGAAEDDNDVAWWANDGTGASWTLNLIDNNFGGVAGIHCADMDGDGDMDVVGAAETDDDVVWWSNSDGLGTTWTEHIVDFNFNGARSIAAADFDGDGDLDIAATAYVFDDVTWWENADGTGTLWVELNIEDSMNGAYAILSGDVDGDGDPDVVASSSLPTEISWWENVSADLDGDGYGGGNDCDDNDASIYLGAMEISDDGVDQDCNGFDLITCYVDTDGDGHGNQAGAITMVGDSATCIDGGAAPNADDCDENDPATYTGAPEIDGDGIDQDCNGFIDLITCYIDADGDGYGNDTANTTEVGDAASCSEGNAADYADDCDDSNPAVNPGAAESGITACSDGLDNNCDGALDAVDVDCGGNGPGDDDDASADDDDDDTSSGDDDDTSGGDDDDTSSSDDDDSADDDDDDTVIGDDDDAGPGQVEGQFPGECEDGADNDADGNYDCDDTDCTGAPVCQAAEEGCNCAAGGASEGPPAGLLLLLLALTIKRRRHKQ